ncbi:glycerate kinase [Tepidamorphus sp. 3E244]|uniref:glycerate kinase type-2 family protein n=1 Tax=Tepidamorphus sp. 3E244 TaxID=3385498 RepID=UPI0038FC4AC0
MSEPSAHPEAFLRELLDAAVGAALPEKIIAQNLPKPPRGRTIVVGAGKASAAMARALEAAWEGPLTGLVVTRYGHAVNCSSIKIVEAAHPVPDKAGLSAACDILELVSGLSEDDLVIALISGGGSALLTKPAAGLTLADKQAVNTGLLRSGAPIGEMNCVRKHLSGIKGGRLTAASAPARMFTIAISDVPGDDPAVIASGPTVPDPSTTAQAREILAKYGFEVPQSVTDWLARDEAETPKPGDAIFANSDFRMAATPAKSLEAAAEVVRKAGLEPVMLGDDLEGEARDVGVEHARLAKRLQDEGRRCVLLSGGETTVTVRGKGRGGRNTEYLLGHALELGGARGIHTIACDTDGIDGSEDNAGAWCGPSTLKQAEANGADPRGLLNSNDAYTCFEAAGTLVVTGPTLTNVNDFRATLID